jgi:hypothetical protein
MRLNILFPAIIMISSFPHLGIFSQSRWIQTYHENEDVVIHNVKESYDKGYLLLGKHGPNYSKYNWLIKTNINGEVLWEKTIGNGVNSIALLDMEQDNSGNIYLGGSTKAYDPQGDPLILKLNPCGEKEWCTIFYTEDNHDFASCFTITQQENLVAVLQYTSGESWVDRICLANLSSDGDLLWKKCYTTSDTSQRNEDIYDIMITPDSGFLLTGDCYYEDPTVPNKWWLHPYYLKVDSQGNFEWETVVYKESELEGGNTFSTVVSPDSQFFYSSGRHNYHEEDFSSPSLLKLDLQGNLVSVHDIVYGYKEGKLTDAQFINDSTLAASSGWGNSDYDLWSRAVIIDTLGNLLNSTVLIPDFFTSFLSLAYDGKLVYCSNELVDDQFNVYLTKLNQDLGQDSIYTRIFTYDSLCPYQIVSDTIVQDDCGLIVGIEEEEVKGGQGEEGKRRGLEIWPNPARDIVDFRFSMVDFRGDFSLEIYDMFGRTAPTPIPDPSPSRGKGGEWQVDVSALPPGIYLAVVREGTSIVASGKFVVVR